MKPVKEVSPGADIVPNSGDEVDLSSLPLGVLEDEALSQNGHRDFASSFAAQRCRHKTLTRDVELCKRPSHAILLRPSIKIPPSIAVPTRWIRDDEFELLHFLFLILLLHNAAGSKVLIHDGGASFVPPSPRIADRATMVEGGRVFDDEALSQNGHRRSPSSLQQTLPCKLLRPSIMIPPSMLYPPGGFDVSNYVACFYQQ